VALFSAQRKGEKAMTCIRCKHNTAYKFGTYGKRRIQRYRCHSCKATFADAPEKTLGRHYTNIDRASKVLSMMLEGVSIRAISRLMEIDKNTIMSLMVSAGERARALFDSRVRAIPAKFVQADEVWSFCHTKEARTHKDDPADWGHSYLWVAMDAQSKMVLAYHTGKRSPNDAYKFVSELANRIHGYFQLTTDGYPAYLKPVEDLLWSRTDYAQLVKVFQNPANAGPDWYGTGTILKQVPSEVHGMPDPRHISTSYVERWNLGLRMHLRRFTRLTNAHSKKLENQKAAISLYMAWYNFCRVHSSLRVTPAMEAGLTDHVWSLSELLTT
jgi:transposase-like protein/IS1 family transposase